MCDLIFLPDATEVGSINELEATFGLPVDAFHPRPEELNEPVVAGQVHIKDCCLCHVDTAGYLDKVGATWRYVEEWAGDIIVLTMPT